ncbi:MAG TPA: serine/threonine protein kinase, partial [Polyangiaceae bacterium]|nr:serine/threonine protein kinase [Polyangiaceae bacterium]
MSEPTFACRPRGHAEPAPRRSRPTPTRVIAERYELIEPIGSGGMGTVWRARDRHLAIEVAVKLVTVDADTPPTVSRRVLVEARAAAKIRHASTVRVFGSGLTEEQEPYVVMELLSGESLEERLERDHRLEAVDALKLLLPVVGAVAAAHEMGVIHRDIKPSNIFLSTESTGRTRPKLLDFGIAKHLDAAPVNVTMPGAILGTPSYMSPEQARGQADVDARSDQWSLAAVFYEVLAGEPPFGGDNYNAVIAAVLVDEPRPLDHIDPELGDIVMRGLRKERHERWPSMRAMGEALARWLLRQGHEHDVTASALRMSSLFPSGGPGPSLRVTANTSDGLAVPLRVAGLKAALRDSLPPRRTTRWAWAAAIVGGLTAGASSVLVGTSSPATSLEAGMVAAAIAPSAPLLVAPASPEASPEASPPPRPPPPASSSSHADAKRP